MGDSFNSCEYFSPILTIKCLKNPSETCWNTRDRIIYCELSDAFHNIYIYLIILGSFFLSNVIQIDVCLWYRIASYHKLRCLLCKIDRHVSLHNSEPILSCCEYTKYTNQFNLIIIATLDWFFCSMFMRNIFLLLVLVRLITHQQHDILILVVFHFH